MCVNDIILELAVQIYQEPLWHVREETNYPNLNNPLHIAILLIDCDSEITINGMLGFLENPTGRHLQKTIEALIKIGAPKCAAILESVRQCMENHNITWVRLRGDFEGVSEYEITSFEQLHGNELNAFAGEIGNLTGDFLLLNPRYSPDDAYSALTQYLKKHADDLQNEIDKRIAQKP